MVDDFIMTMEDVRKSRICAHGAYKWFKSHNLDFKDFLKNGIPASKLIATGDAFAIGAVEATRERRFG
ncbi:hypothetical protein G3A39_39340 [Paraburkholderia aspalathi]|nr:hypothetical protein [Paraburkholderia aspalathi]